MQIITCLIPLTQGQITIVSPEDYDFLMQWKWHAHKDIMKHGVLWYAMRGGVKPVRRLIIMHREIAQRMGLPDSPQYDHADGNCLNNVRQNIRLCTHGQNVANSAKRPFTSSRFKGVSWMKEHQKWVAYISVNGQRHYLGLYNTEEAAARAYDRAALKYFGEFARLNFPNSMETQSTVFY